MKRDIRKKEHSAPVSTDKAAPSKYEVGLPDDTRVVHSDEANLDDGD